MLVTKIAIVGKWENARLLAETLKLKLLQLGVKTETLDLMGYLRSKKNPSSLIQRLIDLDYHGPEIHIGTLEMVRRHYDNDSDYINEHAFVGAVVKHYILMSPYGMIFIIADQPGALELRDELKRDGQESTVLPPRQPGTNVHVMLQKVEFKGHGSCELCKTEADLINGWCAVCRDKIRGR